MTLKAKHASLLSLSLLIPTASTHAAPTKVQYLLAGAAAGSAVTVFVHNLLTTNTVAVSNSTIQAAQKTEIDRLIAEASNAGDLAKEKDAEIAHLKGSVDAAGAVVGGKDTRITELETQVGTLEEAKKALETRNAKLVAKLKELKAGKRSGGDIAGAAASDGELSA